MHTVRYIVCLGWLTLLSGSVAAQRPGAGSVIGSVKAKGTSLPIENASVVILSVSDSSLVSGGMTDSKGSFAIEHIPEGSYYAVISCVGYKSIRTAALKIDRQHSKVELGRLTLTETTVILNPVTVTGEKSTDNNSVDRKIYNVQRDLMAQAGSASDLLQNVPSVTVDIDGNVSLRGSSDVLILINGRPSPLMDKNRADILQQIPANSIERIEVITNPSAKYKPNGTGGMINLVLKKNTNEGLGGTITTNGGFDSRYNGGFSLNYNPGHFNIFGNYGYRKDTRNRHSQDNRDYIYQPADTSSFYNEADGSIDDPQSHLVSLGIDVDLRQHDRVGVSGSYFYRGFTRNEVFETLTQNNASVYTGDLVRNRFDHEIQRDNEATIYYDLAFAKPDHKLHAEFTTANQPEDEDNKYTNTYKFPTQPQSFDNTKIDQGETHNQFTLDYTNPLTAHSTLESGLALEARNDDFDYYVANYDTTRQAFVIDLTKTNHFLYEQRIDAAYATLKESFGRLSVLGGLRYEYVHNNANLITLDSGFTTDYSGFYPTLHLSYQLNKNSELQLNYSRRTNRPDGESLNPFPEYRDPLNLRVGNPHLLPEYIHSVELDWQRRSDQLTITPSVYYRYRTNGFTSISTVVQDSVLETTSTNLAHDQSGGIELVADGSLGALLTADLSANVFYNSIDASNLGYSSNKSIVSWSNNCNFNFKVSHATELQLNTGYQSSRLTPQGRYLPSFVLNIGARHRLLAEKLSLVVTLSDVLKTRRQHIELNSLGLIRNFEATRDAQVFYVGAVYHFGSTTKKTKEKPLEFDSNN